MGEPFTVQIGSDLVRRLTGDDNKKTTRKPKAKVRPDHPSKNQGSRVEVKPSKDIGGWQPGLPPLLPPGAFPPLADKELDPIRKVLDESERVVDKLKKEEARVLEEVKRKAKELHEKEYRMPEQKPVPCSSARDACIQCYKDHPADPLQCAEVVKSFVDCVRRIQQEFVASG
eukprot:Gb_03576 [translate_table: standard]